MKPEMLVGKPKWRLDDFGFEWDVLSYMLKRVEYTESAEERSSTNRLRLVFEGTYTPLAVDTIAVELTRGDVLNAEVSLYIDGEDKVVHGLKDLADVHRIEPDATCCFGLKEEDDWLNFYVGDVPIFAVPLTPPTVDDVDNWKALVLYGNGDDFGMIAGPYTEVADHVAGNTVAFRGSLDKFIFSFDNVFDANYKYKVFLKVASATRLLSEVGVDVANKYESHGLYTERILVDVSNADEYVDLYIVEPGTEDEKTVATLFLRLFV